MKTLLVDKKKVLKVVDEILDGIRNKTSDILKMIFDSMIIVLGTYKNLFELINKHPEFFRGVIEDIIDSINYFGMKFGKRMDDNPEVSPQLKLIFKQHQEKIEMLSKSFIENFRIK